MKDGVYSDKYLLKLAKDHPLDALELTLKKQANGDHGYEYYDVDIINLIVTIMYKLCEGDK
jgi:hypothetical protein